ncbi:hypothetical protein EDB84DRAFT_1562947 [Lactarius hengduanensis]|nr:hypothetical protein EDB84DRAFT_1562947 [Lactarius hengduanensis]
MEEDLDYALEVWAEATLTTKNGGIYASDHAPRPSRNPPHSRFTFPVTLHGQSLSPLAERPAMAPLPVPLIDPSPALVEPTPAPPVAAPVDALAQLTAAITATISRLEAKLEAGLEAQSKRIDALLTSRDPRPRPAKAQSAKAKEAVAAPPAPNTAKAPGPPATDETIEPMNCPC